MAGKPGKSGRKPAITGQNPAPSRDLPPCPAWLDSIAQQKWHEKAAELAELGVLTKVDGDALAAYCIAWSELQHASETLAKEGRTFETEKGYIVQHPAVAMQRSALKALREFSSNFGLDPGSRQRIKVQPKSDEVDEMEQFLKGASN